LGVGGSVRACVCVCVCLSVFRVNPGGRAEVSVGARVEVRRVLGRARVRRALGSGGKGLTLEVESLRRTGHL